MLTRMLMITCCCVPLVCGLTGCSGDVVEEGVAPETDVAQQSPSDSPPSDAGSDDNGTGRRHYDRQAGYSVELPADWKVEDGALMSPDLGDDDPFVENANVVIMKTNAASATDFISDLKGQLRSSLNAFTEVSEKAVMIGGKDGMTLVYTYEDTEAVANAKGKAIAFVVVEQGKVGAFILAALDSTFAEWEKTFHEIGGSFRLE